MTMTFKDISLPVVVLRMDHYGALGVMRSLGRLGVRVYGVHAAKECLGSYSKYCREVFKWDLDNAPPEESVEYLTRISERIGRKSLLIATNDETALFVSENAGILSRHFVFPSNPPELVRSLYEKKAMYFMAKRLNIPTAETMFPGSKAELLELSQNVQFPVMLKASDNIVISKRNGKKMVIARTREQLLQEYDRMEDPVHPSLMLQEYIPGNEDTAWMFNGYFDENSNLLFGLTGRKLHQTPVYTGMTALGICLKNPIVQTQTEYLVQSLGYRGILDIDYRYDERDGKYKLLDVNPRLGATFRLFVGQDGMDVVRAEYLHFTGQSVPQSSLCEGRKWIVEDEDLVSCFQYFVDGVLPLKEWARGYKGIQEGAWFAADDLHPFLRMAWRSCKRPFRRLRRSLSWNSVPA